MEDIVKSSMHVIEIAKLLDEHKAEETVVLNISKMSSWTDYFIICTVRSKTHLKGLVERLNAYLRSNKLKSLNNHKITGDQDWFLIDCGDFVIHLMEKEKREFYELEKLWFKGETLYHSSKSS